MASPASLLFPVESIVSLFSGSSLSSSRTSASSFSLPEDDSHPRTPNDGSPLPCHAQLPRSTSSTSLSSSVATDDSLQRRLAASLSNCPPRRPDTQHLAVLISRDLWKADREASKCDTYHCRSQFGLFDRKHHCRRCGGVFCHECSAQVTSLLDTSKLPFTFPPKGQPIEVHASSSSPMVSSRVCDDCYEGLHGTIPERQMKLRAKSLVTFTPSAPLGRSKSTSCAISTSPRRTRKSSNPSTPSQLTPTRSIPPPIAEDDVFAGYPLRVPSAICKANGGGRWEPTPQPVRWDYRPPGGKALFEIEMEKKEERRRLKLNPPIIRDGDFVMRRCIPPPKPQRRRTTQS